MNTGYVGIEDDYPISIKQVLDITAELGALETQRRVRELPKYVNPDTDTVSRQAVLDAILQKPAWHNSDGSFYHSDDIRDAVNAVPPSPSRPHGKWLPEYGDQSARAHYCSACNFYYTTDPDEMHFCPHCGADMR